MPKEKRNNGKYLNDIKDIVPTGFDLFPYSSGPDAKEELIKNLKEAGFEHRRIDKYYSKFVILPEIGDFIKYYDLHSNTRMVTGIHPGKGFEFETVQYTSENMYTSHDDLLSKLDITDKRTMHIRDLAGRDRGGGRNWYCYTKQPRTYYDPMGHG
jgi:hypothetical protein